MQPSRASAKRPTLEFCAKDRRELTLVMSGEIDGKLNEGKYMTYIYNLENGQRLIVQNDGDQTLVALSSNEKGQQQSQSSGFNTGKWSKTPELFRTRENLVLRVESKGGVD